MFRLVLQSNQVSSSDHRVINEPIQHLQTRTVIMGPYTQLSEYCSARIYEATFYPETDGKLDIKYCQDNFNHAYDPKPFLIEGYYVATYCLPSEKQILQACFESETFLNWKLMHLQQTQEQQRV